MKKYRIANIPGDGIGHELIPVALEVLHSVAEKNDFTIESENFLWGAGHYKKTGQFLPMEGLKILQNFDAIYFGAVGLPEVDDTLPFKLFTNYIRTNFQQYVNYRPVKLFQGIKSPLRNKNINDIDFVIIRENNEGEFVHSGRQLYPERPEGMALDTSIFTRKGIERVAHYAFDLARKSRKKLTNVTKSNTLIYTLAFWDQVIGEVSNVYPDVDYQKMYVDAASANFVLHPEYFDVILTTNMIGDILSDLGGAIMGSLGLGGSGNINPERNFPSMFEPIHGSAPDIAGKNIANPIGQLWSGALMFEHLGENKAANQLMRAINQVTATGEMTPDLGGKSSTNQITNAIIQSIENQ